MTKYAPEIVRYLNWRYGSDGKRMVGAGAQAASASQRAGAGAGEFRSALLVPVLLWYGGIVKMQNETEVCITCLLRARLANAGRVYKREKPGITPRLYRLYRNHQGNNAEHCK